MSAEVIAKSFVSLDVMILFTWLEISVNEVPVISEDSTEIASILKGVKQVYKKRKIISVFEPHRYSRITLLKKEFSKSFVKSDLVLICPMYAAGEKLKLNFNLLNFANLIGKNSKTQVIIVENQYQLVNYFKKNLISDEIVIGMGAGLITHWMRNLKSSL